MKDSPADFPTEFVKEGKVKIMVPKLKAFIKLQSDYAPSKAPVFFNPIMELNRDLAVIAFQAYQRQVGREISICEPFTSSGIRGIRFAVEIEGVEKVLINDINVEALKLADFNVRINKLDKVIKILHGDANCILSCHDSPRKRFDIVDVDPFGSPAPYLDSAIRALRNRGILAATATDLAPLCGVHSKACIRKYGGRPLRTEYCKELGVRILTGCIASIAAKQDIGIHLLFSHCTDHYIRVYAELACGAKKADESLNKLGYVSHCFNCLHREIAQDSFAWQLRCPECGSLMEVAGPLWIDKILSREFCTLMTRESKSRAFKNSTKIKELLRLAEEESEAPTTYYLLDKMSKKLGLQVPPVYSVLELLVQLGYKASPTHFNSRGIRTEASAQAFGEIVKKIVKREKNEGQNKNSRE